jgi:hypothetical protein
MENHGIGDVSHMEFVKANQTVALRHFLAQQIQRIDRATHQSQFAVHFAHEFMKMQACFFLDRDRIEKAIHQKAFASAHAAEHVNPFGNIGAVQQFFEWIRAFGFVGRPFIRTTLQCFDGPQLSGVTLVTPDFQLVLVILQNGHTGILSLKFQKKKPADISGLAI